MGTVGTGTVAAHGDEGHSNGTATNSYVSNLCQFPTPDWRNEQTIAGVHIDESQHCRPDNPYAVAASVKGTNNVPMNVLMKSGYARDTVEKTNDRDGDGDPDVIRITLEVNELNTETAVSHAIAPGVAPSMWVFSPKTQGMVNDNMATAARVVRAPSPPIRVEEGDTMYVELENTHYFPHTIHFHGVDHGYEVNKTGVDGNDGVPQTSEGPIMPGDSRVYKFTPDQPGTMFYHCHVVPNVHVQMGLNGMFVVTENKSDNSVQTFNIGAGKVRHPSKAVTESGHDAVYDLHYQAMNKELTALVKKYDDPRKLATAVNREHDVTDETMDYYLLNGRSFPYTVQESSVIVEPNETYQLNLLNSGPRDIAIHTHGHKFTIKAYDGVELGEDNEIQRDVASVAPAQRATLILNTTQNGLDSYGSGVWIFHDHREAGVTTDGISPGGNINVIVYEEYLNETTGMPETNTDMGTYFNASYYNGGVPYWGGFDGKLSEGDNTSSTTLSAVDHWDATGDDMMMMDMKMVNGGMVVNENTQQLPDGCSEIKNTRTITVNAGEQYAEEGEMFAYDKEQYNFDTCTKVTVTVNNTDEIRHQWMIHGLPSDTYPMGMFTIEVNGGEQVTGTFITPSEPGQFKLHCSLPKHESMGMHATVVVGDPGSEWLGESPFAVAFGALIGVAALVGVIYAIHRRRGDS